MTKVLFLDIDGVCNSEQTHTKDPSAYFPIDKYLAFLIGKIQLDTNCEVVLSSSWRHHKPSIEEIEKRIVKISDITTKEHKEIRGYEIETWLEDHPEVTKYAILDDDDDMLEKQKPNFFKTSWKIGITKEIADSIITHLNS